ncbi:MAG: efflux RND transporter permease subunit, partial [Caulobacteraceae bacterium]|nr:efflux RND transporter permease subunit [Caulobacter sp.]
MGDDTAAPAPQQEHDPIRAPIEGDDGRFSPSRVFIMRPIATSLLMIAIFLTGVIGFQFLPLSALPEVDYPTIQVQTFYPGASPEVTTSTITAPLERQFGEMPGLAVMTSTSSAGASIITLQFGLDLTLDIAEQEVQAAINAAGNLLPSDLPNPPVYAKVNPADAPIITLALTSTTLPLTQVEDIADTRMAQKLSQVAGVGLVTVSGGQRPAVRIQANPNALTAKGLTLESLRTAISSANVNGAKGSFDGKERAFNINANDQLLTAKDYVDLVIAYRDGAPIYLHDVADVIDGAENAHLGAYADTTQAVILNVQRQPGANVIGVVDHIQKLLPELTQTLPAGVTVRQMTDRTVTIRASVEDVEFELGLAILLVVLVIFVFLRNWRATLISGISVPLSLVGALGLMYLLGFSLNNLTLMSMTIATGFVVDDAIVMIENISRHLEEGMPPRAAALKGAGEIGFTIISLTVSLLAVLIPLLFMADVVGRLFREFAITLAITIVISAIVSLTLVPSLCAVFLKPEQHPKPGSWAEKSERAFDWVIARYDRGLGWVLAHQALTLVVAIATFLLTAALYLAIPKGLFPTQDTGEITGVLEAPQAASYQHMMELSRDAAGQILKDPDIANVSTFVGVDAQNVTLNTARLLIELKPLHGRASAGAIIRRLRTEVEEPGVRLFLQPVQDLTLDSATGRTAYHFTLGSADQAALDAYTERLVDKLRATNGLEQVSSDRQDQGLSAQIVVDRDTAGRLGISLASIDNILYDAFGQRIVSTVFTQSNQYRVILEAQPSYQQGLESLRNLYLTSSSGQPVPMSAIATVQQQPSALQVSHIGQFPANTISFNLAHGQSLGAAVDLITKAERDIGVPASISTNFSGAAAAYQASLSNELWLILAAIVAIYIVLGVLYESFIHPITI